MRFPLPDHSLIEGQIYKLWLCFSLDGQTAMVEKLGSKALLYQTPNPRSRTLGEVPLGSWVVYLAQEPFNEYDGYDSTDYMMVKVIYGDMVGWLALYFKDMFRASTFFTSQDEVQRTQEGT